MTEALLDGSENAEQMVNFNASMFSYLEENIRAISAVRSDSVVLSASANPTQPLNRACAAAMPRIVLRPEKIALHEGGLMKNPYMTRQALTASLAFAGFTPLQVVRNRG